MWELCRTGLIGPVLGELAQKAAGHQLSAGLRIEAGIIVHRNTSVYISRNEVERRLGTYVYEYQWNLDLTFSQFDLVYTWINPHPSPSVRCPSQ